MRPFDTFLRWSPAFDNLQYLFSLTKRCDNDISKITLSPFLAYLTNITGSNISIYSTYILFLTKLQKRQTMKKGFALIKKWYHTNFLDMIRVFYRYLFSWNGLIINKKNVVWDFHIFFLLTDSTSFYLSIYTKAIICAILAGIQ